MKPRNTELHTEIVSEINNIESKAYDQTPMTRLFSPNMPSEMSQPKSSIPGKRPIKIKLKTRRGIRQINESGGTTFYNMFSVNASIENQPQKNPQ